jgi:hypothetical protein
MRPGQVIGVVRDELGMGLPGVTVVLDSADVMKRVMTDSLGRFTIAGVDTGTHLIRAVRIGFSPFERRFDVPARGAWIEIDMPRLTQLDTIPVRAERSGVFGKVIARQRYAPLANATVTLIGAGTPARTDSTGDFALPGVPPGPWIVNVERAGYDSRMLSFVMPQEGGVELSVVLDESSLPRNEKLRAAMLSEFATRVRARGTASAVVARQELSGRFGLTVKDALRFSPSFLLSGLVINDSLACIFVDGLPVPNATAQDFPAGDVIAVEVYGTRADHSNTLLTRWPRGSPCGLGGGSVPRTSGAFGLQPTGVRPGRLPMDRYVRAIVIWTRQDGR